MDSQLIITSVERLQSRIESQLREMGRVSILYVSLNKTQKSTENALKKAKIKTKNIFFIDCVALEEMQDGVFHIAPDDLFMLRSTIASFGKKMKGQKVLLIDTLSTLLFYNNEEEVAKFIKMILEDASQKNMGVLVFNPKTKGEELLHNIFSFFDKVDKR